MKIVPFFRSGIKIINRMNPKNLIININFTHKHLIHRHTYINRFLFKYIWFLLIN